MLSRFNGGIAAVFALLSLGPAGDGGRLHWSRDGVTGRYSATGVIIQIGEHGPMLASAVSLALPPMGGDIPLTHWRWDVADTLGGVGESNGTRWTIVALTVEGIWNGSTLAVDRVRTRADDGAGPFDVSNTCAYPVDVSVLAATAGVIGWSMRGDEGSCELVDRAIGPSMPLEEVLANLGKHAQVEYMLSRVD